MGADPVDALRQMKNTATDPYSGGRNFCSHYSVREVERRAGDLAHRGAVLDGAGHGARQQARAAAAASRSCRAATPARPRATSPRASSGARARATSCPCLMIVTNNQWGISTAAARAARREAHRRPRQGVRHRRRGHRRQRSRGVLPRARRRRWTTCAPSASRSCSRRWCRASTGTRRRRAPTS